MFLEGVCMLGVERGECCVPVNWKHLNASFVGVKGTDSRGCKAAIYRSGIKRPSVWVREFNRGESKAPSLFCPTPTILQCRRCLLDIPWHRAPLATWLMVLVIQMCALYPSYRTEGGFLELG